MIIQRHELFSNLIGLEYNLVKPEIVLSVSWIFRVNKREFTWDARKVPSWWDIDKKLKISFAGKLRA